MGGIENVEKLMGETADAIAYQNEVSEMLGGKISNQDEDEVEDELAALEAEMSESQPQPQPLPNVPDTELPAQKTEPERQPTKVRQKQPERQAMLAS